MSDRPTKEAKEHADTWRLWIFPRGFKITHVSDKKDRSGGTPKALLEIVSLVVLIPVARLNIKQVQQPSWQASKQASK